MSNRPASTRGRASEKDGTILEPVTSRQDVKAGEFNPRPRIQSDRSPGPGPSRGGRWQTTDRNDSSTRFSFGKPKDRNDASFIRRRNTDKMGGFGRGGRRGDALGHGGQTRNGQTETSSSSSTHGGGKLFLSREFNTGSDMKSSVGGFCERYCVDSGYGWGLALGLGLGLILLGVLDLDIFACTCMLTTAGRNCTSIIKNTMHYW